MTTATLERQEPVAPAVPPRPKIFIDSGAFSAWRLGKPVDLDAYCNFLEAAQEWGECYACLDVIIPDDPEEAAKQSFDNLVLMRSRGFAAIPVWHVREDVKWVKKMLDIGCDYIGLSATSIVSRTATDHWYDLAWSYLVDSTGAPLVKAHAFGEARTEVLLRYPWASADSSTWLNGQKHGFFYMENGKLLSHRKGRNPGSRANADIDELGGEDAEILADELDRLGIDPESLKDRAARDAWLARSYLAARRFLALEARVRGALPIRYRPKSVGLITRPDVPHRRPREFPDHFDLYLACGTNNTAIPSLHVAGCRSFLASYYYISDRQHERLRSYCSDPDETVRQAPFVKYLNDLQRIVKDEGLRGC